VAIYCRVATDDQSCERQERDLRAFAKRVGHKIVAVFKETASGADNARPERAKVLALARAHEIDAILVIELSRWGRSTQDLVQTLDDLHSLRMGERRRGDPSHNCAWADRHNRGGKKIAGLDRLGAKPEKLARARTDLRTMQDYLGTATPSTRPITPALPGIGSKA
jgi:hypothetical protein